MDKLPESFAARGGRTRRGSGLSYPLNDHDLQISDLNENPPVNFFDFSTPERNIKGKSPVKAPNDPIHSLPPNAIIVVGTSIQHPHPFLETEVDASVDVGKNNTPSYPICTEIGESYHRNVQTQPLFVSLALSHPILEGDHVSLVERVKVTLQLTSPFDLPMEDFNELVSQMGSEESGDLAEPRHASCNLPEGHQAGSFGKAHT